jgi:hypothetical protein
MDKLKFINEQMTVLAVPYEFGEWSSEVKYPYFVGEEITEDAPLTEDGYEASTLLLVGWNRGSYLELETIKEKIKKHFNAISGCCGRTDSGSIAVFYAGSFSIPSGEAELKKIQINLIIKEWKGAM